MAANVRSILELGLREAAEDVWARKVALEIISKGATPPQIVRASWDHGRALGRAQGVALSLELIDSGVDDEDTPPPAGGPLFELANTALESTLAAIGDQVWDYARIARVPGVDITYILDRIDSEASWSTAANTAALLTPPNRLHRPL